LALWFLVKPRKAVDFSVQSPFWYLLISKNSSNELAFNPLCKLDTKIIIALHDKKIGLNFVFRI